MTSALLQSTAVQNSVRRVPQPVFFFFSARVCDCSCQQNLVIFVGRFMASALAQAPQNKRKNNQSQMCLPKTKV